MAKPYLFSDHACFPLGVFSYPLMQIGVRNREAASKSINWAANASQFRMPAGYDYIEVASIRGRLIG